MLPLLLQIRSMGCICGKPADCEAQPQVQAHNNALRLAAAALGTVQDLPVRTGYHHIVETTSGTFKPFKHQGVRCLLQPAMQGHCLRAHLGHHVHDMSKKLTRMHHDKIMFHHAIEGHAVADCQESIGMGSC